MPNTGRPSLDCHLCRRRRVKCDLARPGCKRCEKYGVDCPGYRDQSELVFRNAFPARQRQAVRDQYGDLAGGFDPFITFSAAGSTPVSNNRALAAISPGEAVPPAWTYAGDTAGSAAMTNYVQRPLSEHWTSHSVPILLNVYSTLDFLHQIYKVEQRDGPLLWAAHLFTRTYILNLRYPTAVSGESNDDTRKELAMYMSKTLRAVSRVLSTPQGALRDDVLATVWILASYEILVGSLSRTGRLQEVSPWKLHTGGLYNILKARGKARLMTVDDRSAFWPAFNMVQIQALVANKECPAESEEWLDVIEGVRDESEGMSLYVGRFITKVAHVSSRVISILHSGDVAAGANEYLHLWTTLTTAERSLNDWIDVQPALEHEFDPYMRNLQYSAIITGFHFIHLLINLMTHYEPCPVPLQELFAHRRYCLQSVRVASCGVMDNVPYAMGPFAKGRDKSPRVLFDALKLIWPLCAIYIVPSTRPEHKTAAEKVLHFIGKEVGVLQALNTKPAKVDLPKEVLVPRDIGEPLELPWVSPPSKEFDLGID